MWAAIEDRAEALKSFKQKHLEALATKIDEMDEPKFSDDHDPLPGGIQHQAEDPDPPEPLVTLLICVFILADPSYEGNIVSISEWVLMDDWNDMKAMLVGDPLYLAVLNDEEKERAMIKSAERFHKALIDTTLPEETDFSISIQRIKELMGKENFGYGRFNGKFDGNKLRKISKAAHGLLQWVEAVVAYYDIRREMKETMGFVPHGFH